MLSPGRKKGEKLEVAANFERNLYLQQNILCNKRSWEEKLSKLTVPQRIFSKNNKSILDRIKRAIIRGSEQALNLSFVYGFSIETS